MITLANNSYKSIKGKKRMIARYIGVGVPTETIEIMAVTSKKPIGFYKGWTLLQRELAVSPIEIGGKKNKPKGHVALYYREVGTPTAKQWIKFYFKKVVNFPKRVGWQLKEELQRIFNGEI